VHERPLTTTYDDATSSLLVSGSVDEMSGTQLREAIHEHSNSFTRDLTVDLTDVDFLPSLGVGVLAVAMRTAKEQDVTLDLLAASGTIAQQVLNICGLTYREN
jgi:anti-anti-sigma factor